MIFAQHAGEAENYKCVLEDLGIPTLIESNSNTISPLSVLSRCVPVLVPGEMLEDAYEIIARVEQRIQELQGHSIAAGSGQRRPRQRLRNERSLSNVVRKLLGGSKNGYALSELAERVLATGYKTNSANFKNVLYQCLYNSDKFVHDKEARTYHVTK